MSIPSLEELVISLRNERNRLNNENLKLQTDLAAAKRVNINILNEWSLCKDKLDALRPWAKIGKQFMARKAWIKLINLTPVCLICERRLIGQDSGYLLIHPDADDCPIPALLAQLETEHAHDATEMVSEQAS